MARSTPYTYIQCPCSGESTAEQNGSESESIEQDDDRTFDPRAPRSVYSLYPLEHLLYCEDCQQIRCPRCVTEETVTYFCPNCLFEVPSSNLRSEGNSCYQCPVCIGPLQVSAVQAATGAAADASLAPPDASATSTYALFCQYCNWTSSEVGIDFDRPSGIHSQLAKVKNGGTPKLTLKEVKERRKENPDGPPLPDEHLDRDLQFASLKSFYQEQLADVNTSLSGMPLRDTLGFSSPAALSRIMSLYTGKDQPGRAQKGPTDVVREALTSEEGLKVADLDETNSIKQLMQDGWHSTVSLEQRQSQLDHQVKFQGDLRPIPYLLRTKRSKRCPICRHIISKPESKVTSTRFKIRLVAKSYIPTMSIRPMQPTAPAVPVTQRPAVPEEAPLQPLKPYQYILTFKNPLFDKIKVTLAAPNVTPGRIASKVTVLCPQFEVDANTDMWDDALKEDGAERTRKGDENAAGQGEAGKIWERGRNWVSIVVEVVPASLRHPTPGTDSGGPLREDEDVLEIPMFVRMEWEADTQHDISAGTSGDKETRERRELAYWCVLGVGRISQE